MRPVPAALRERYLAEGWWTDETLGALVDRSPARRARRRRSTSGRRRGRGTAPTPRSTPTRCGWSRALADAGLEPGDVVAFQLPNWREAVVAFYGLAMGGYVLVPIVHIYGPKEVRFILGQSRARAYISADRYGHVDYLDIVDGAAPDELPDLALHVVVGSADGAAARATSGASRGTSSTRPRPPRRSAPPIRDDVCVLAYTSGTTSDPRA